MNSPFIIITGILLFSVSFTFKSSAQNAWEEDKIDVVSEDESVTLISAEDIFSEGWSDLAHPNFWKQIMRLSPDSCIVNVAATREIVTIMSHADWNKQTDAEKDAYRSQIRQDLGLEQEARIYVTTGKRDFYKFDVVYPTISKGIEAFENNHVDPWYAQAILLIESPGQLKKSNAGAYGPFQLMPSVARAQGLTVTKYKDERANFDRSAFASSQLIKNVCIPEAKRILDAHNLVYSEQDLWFRLFVLHVYHAGSANVAAVVNKISPENGAKELITQMWVTTAANFGNNSQNYSQLALASQLILHEIAHERCDYIHDCAMNYIEIEPVN